MENFLHSLTIVIPIIFVLAFGFFAQKAKAFGKDANPIPSINELVLTFALPPSLFIGTISVSRTRLFNEFPLFFSLLVSLLIAYFVGFILAKYIFKRNIIESSIAGLAVSFSAGPFYGPALLSSIYGITSEVSVSMISLVINVVIVPIATIIIKLNLAKTSSQQNDSLGKLIGVSIYQSIFKTPFVWAPLLAFIFVFLDIKIPTVAVDSLDLIGKATAGLAVFVAGMTIASNKFTMTGEVLFFAALKNIALPALFFAIALVIGMTKGTAVFNQGLLLAALPSGPMIVLLATRYKQYQQEASSILAVSTVGMMVTVTLLITILNIS